MISNYCMRFYMLDRVVHLEKNKSIDAIKCWTQTEDIFADHFPTMPIVPGVLIIEAMCQALGILMEETYPDVYPENKDGVWSILSMLNKAKFKKFLIPGDRMEIHGELTSLEKNYGSGIVTVSVEKEFRASAEISLVFFPRSKMKNPELLSQRANYVNFLFNGHKMNEYT